jgi:hypothetical protein
MKVNIGKYHKNDSPRTIKVQIDPWDTVSADHTLALIILPLLKQFRANIQGGIYVDNEDVPEHAPIPEGQEIEMSDAWASRWEWVVDEMVNAFSRIADDDWEQDYHNGGEFDAEGYKKEGKRIDNGLRLFGKYFRGLWT